VFFFIINSELGLRGGFMMIYQNIQFIAETRSTCKATQLQQPKQENLF